MPNIELSFEVIKMAFKFTCFPCLGLLFSLLNYYSEYKLALHNLGIQNSWRTSKRILFVWKTSFVSWASYATRYAGKKSQEGIVWIKYEGMCLSHDNLSHDNWYTSININFNNQKLTLFLYPTFSCVLCVIIELNFIGQWVFLLSARLVNFDCHCLGADVLGHKQIHQSFCHQLELGLVYHS